MFTAPELGEALAAAGEVLRKSLPSAGPSDRDVRIIGALLRAESSEVPYSAKILRLLKRFQR